jgi:outer membrane protein OmpA-like peptidoglycan-associated protein
MSSLSLARRAAYGVLMTVVVEACHRDARRTKSPADSIIAATKITASDTGAMRAIAENSIAHLAERDTDSHGVGIVDGDLRPGTATADPDSAVRMHEDAAETRAELPSPTGIPLVKGLRLTSALHFPEGDRENVVTVSDISSEGVTYRWRFRQQRRDGTILNLSASRPVSLNDLASAPRLNQVFEAGDRPATPGYTAMSLSRAVFSRVQNGGSVPFTVTNLELDPLAERFGAIASPRMNYHGRLIRASSGPESMPILLNGVRTRVPVLHLRGHFTLQEKSVDDDFWVLADSTHPLLMRSVEDGEVLQMIRIDRPNHEGTPSVEDALTRECRTELPGVYFAFASAELDPESGPALAGVAGLLSHHPNWSLAIEGHTDSIGAAATNQSLSERRASAVRSALIAQFHIDASRLRAIGFGATKPKESNATLDGRARNRRVEVVRPCERDHIPDLPFAASVDSRS